MNEKEKKNTLEERQREVAVLSTLAYTEYGDLQKKIISKRDIVGMMTKDPAMVAIQGMRIGRLEELTILTDSPFFSRMTGTFEGRDEREIFYIGKFGMADEHVYSWISPIARLRFANIGPTSYETPLHESRSVVVFDRESYHIVHGKILFLSRSDQSRDKELIHQEHFTRKKEGFMLPEIVAQMEQAQDIVIRLDHEGPMVISGPAGSGKTTLALHRVAFLKQSPDTASLFAAKKGSIVFVQDGSTRDYFTHLLPSLGIHDVTIITYVDWARDILLFSDTIAIVTHAGSNMQSRDRLAFAKNQADISSSLHYRLGDTPWGVLDSIYGSLDTGSMVLWERQKKDKVLDVADMTFLLQVVVQSGPLVQKQTRYVLRDGASPKKVTKEASLEYDLILVDEFENYTPSQLQVLTSTLSKKTNTIMFVGDMHQQTHMGTVQDWSDFGYAVPTERQIMLHKVYRNTQSILRYIRSRGYDVDIPDQLAEGEGVIQEDVPKDQLPEYLMEYFSQETYEEGCVVGVVVFEDALRIHLAEWLRSFTCVRVVSVHEAQGVEFEHVIVLEESSSVDIHDTSIFGKEMEKVNRDRLYVALTRAMKTLRVIVLV